MGGRPSPHFQLGRVERSVSSRVKKIKSKYFSEFKVKKKDLWVEMEFVDCKKCK